MMCRQYAAVLGALATVLSVGSISHVTAQGIGIPIAPVKTTAEAAEKVQRFEQFALTHNGDPDHGQQLFLDEKLTKCVTCHKIKDRGGDVGPELTAIGGKFARPHLIESLLEPSRQIVEGYRTSMIATDEGQVKTGIVKTRSDTNITLVDADGKTHHIAVADIIERKESPVSLMPEGLVNDLSPTEFTDIIAYMETLRPGGKTTPGAGITGPIELPPGFEIQIIASGLTGCTAMQVLPDGRLLVCEQTGRLRMVKNNQLLPQPVLTVPVDSYWERGLIGVTIDPDFPSTPHIYVCYVAKEPYPHHHVSRFTMRGDVAEPGSEKILLKGDDQTKLGGKVPAGHQGGGLHFGTDGKLYISIGEQTAEEPSQHLDSFLGKILCINPDGTFPEDNPFYHQARGKYRAIWALGFRNPFSFAIRQTNGDMLINDIGGTYEEINRGVAGGNYGWPAIDHGPTDDPRFIGPVHYYKHASACGADFSSQDLPWPEKYRGKYIFAEYILGWIKTLDPEHPERVETFATGLRNPVDLRFAPDGSLYVLVRNAWVLDHRFQPNTGSLLRIRYTGDKKTGAGDVDTDGGVMFTENAIDQSAGGLPAFKIETSTATYFLEKSGAGLSSLVDKDGNDWLGFHPRAGSGAAGEYRGFPNAVHRQAGSYFHPKNQGTDPATTTVEYSGSDRVTISAQSSNGLWTGRYDFLPTHCTFTMTRMPADKKYWVLYEGTPGGQYDDDDWWMTSASPKRRLLTENHEGDIPSPEWIAFGDKRLPRSLFILHHQDDSHPDRFYQMQKKMTVFGFGRKGLDKFIDSVPRRFSIGLVESVEYEDVAEVVESVHE